MELQTTIQIVTTLINKSDNKSLGNLLIYIYERWVEEQHYEDFNDYAKFMKNGLRKVTPKGTKFVSFTHDLDKHNTIQLHLTILLQGSEHNLKISVCKRNLAWCLVTC
jgi:hypothetical protein